MRYERKHNAPYNPEEDLIIDTSFDELKSFGFYFLTGEACALGQRMLMLLSREGADTLTEYLGLPYGAKYADPPNSTLYVAGEKIPAVGSFMMPRDAGFMHGLVKFLLMRLGYRHVIQHDSLFVGTNKGSDCPYHPDYMNGSHSHLKNGHVHWNPLALRNPHPHAGTKNFHAFTGGVL